MKKILLVVIVVAVGFFSCACGKKSQAEIEFMTWGSKTEIDIIKPIIEDYNKTHDVKINCRLFVL